MKMRSGGRKVWKVPTLIRRALRSTSDESYWACVRELHLRGTSEVFSESVRLCALKEVKAKVLGIDVLAQLGSPERPFRKESLALLHTILATDRRATVLHSALVAIGHLQKPEDSTGVRRIASLASNSDEHVRIGAVMALTGRTSPNAIATMIRLSGDSSSDVRNWATFGLGSQIDMDSSAIRDALARRLEDSDDDTRCEAIMGLAKRKDPRVREPLRSELNQRRVLSLAVEAAEEYGDPGLLRLL